MYTLISIVTCAFSYTNLPAETVYIEKIRSEMQKSSPYTTAIQQESQPTERYNKIKINLESELKSSA